ncbi:MAG TPA: cation diffusion facilitator family transporter [Gammaproteobacteria bacterium]|nr:cation diffusion facilitator family transporter [Gammaproteobacteria bacterium]
MTSKETRISAAVPAGSERLLRAATTASVTVAATLVLVKFAAWLLTDSVSLLSTLVDSLLDVAASFLNLLAVRHALEPPDREHRFGHGKAEPLGALGQAAFITGSALFVLIEAGQRLYEPEPVLHSEIGIGVMLFSIVITFALTRFQAFVVRRTGSVAIRADSLHYLGDLLTNGAVVLAIVLATTFGLEYADPLFAILIAAYILKTAWSISGGALDMLMDRELPDEDRQRIKQIALGHAGVIALHDLRTRAAGPTSFIQLHIEMDGQMTLLEAHRIADDVEKALREAFPRAEVVIHQDPYGAETPRVVEL